MVPSDSDREIVELIGVGNGVVRTACRRPQVEGLYRLGPKRVLVIGG